MTFANLKKNRQLIPATSTMLLILIPLLALQRSSPIGKVTAEMDKIIPNPARHRLHQRQRQKSNKKNHRHHKKHHGRGTLFSFRRPTVDLASEWYATTEKDSYDDIMFHGDETSAAEELFNHDSVGMTNPCLHIDLTIPQPHTINNNINEVVNCGNTATMPQQQAYDSSTANDESNNAYEDLDKLWWPLTSMNEKIDGNGKRLGKNKSGTWRVLRYHRRVGKGQDCYERVRDAALDWSFGDNNGNGNDERGIVRLIKTQKTKSRKKDSPKSLSSTARTTPILREEAHMGGVYNVVHNSFVTDGGFELSSESSKNIAQIWSGPQRKLVTFSATNLLGKLEDKLFSGQRRQRWKPKVYAVNPVMVVYDLVDQRGPSTTFTSTAYATMKGHLLSGECRQTVALRDGIDEEVDIEILSYCRPAPSFWGKVVWPFISPMQTKFFESHMDHLEHAAVAGGNDKVGNQQQHHHTKNNESTIIPASITTTTITTTTTTAAAAAAAAAATTTRTPITRKTKNSALCGAATTTKRIRDNNDEPTSSTSSSSSATKEKCDQCHNSKH